MRKIFFVGAIFFVVMISVVYLWYLFSTRDIGTEKLSTSDQVASNQAQATSQERGKIEGYPKKPAPSSSAHDIGDGDKPLPAPGTIEALPTANVYQALIDGLKNGDDDRLNIAEGVLIDRARAHDKEAVHLLTEGIKREETKYKKYLVNILGEMRTEDSVEALLRLSVSGNADEGLRYDTLAAIAKAGALNDDGTFNEEVSPVLERYLGQGKRDPDLLSAIMTGISKVGSESGITRLLEEMRTASTSEERNIIAQAMTNTLNDHAIPPLVKELEADTDLSEDVTRAAGNALANIGGEATKALLEWAAQLDNQDAQEQAIEWLKQTQDSDLMINASSDYNFKDPAFGKRIEALATKIKPVIEVIR